MERVLFINPTIAERVAELALGFVLHGRRVKVAKVHPLMQRGQTLGWYVIVDGLGRKGEAMTEQMYDQLLRLASPLHSALN